MDYSYVQATKLHCPHCHQTATVDVWLIVDQTARPELIQQILQGDFNTFTCPHCRQTLDAPDEPLLIYQPHQHPPLLFSPAQKTAIPQEQAHNLQRLVHHLLNTLENQDDTWVMEGLKRVHRNQLSTILREALEHPPTEAQ